MNESFQNSNNDREVIDIRTRKPFVGSESIPETVEPDLDVESVDKAFNALTKIVTDEGNRVHLKMGFRDIKKFDRLTPIAKASLQDSFILKIQSDPTLYLPLYFRKTYLEAVKEAGDVFAAGKITEEDFKMRQWINDQQLKDRYAVNDEDIAMLHRMFKLE